MIFHNKDLQLITGKPKDDGIICDMRKVGWIGHRQLFFENIWHFQEKAHIIVTK
jgi:hypothetical protein